MNDFGDTDPVPLDGHTPTPGDQFIFWDMDGSISNVLLYHIDGKMHLGFALYSKRRLFAALDPKRGRWYVVRPLSLLRKEAPAP